MLVVTNTGDKQLLDRYNGQDFIFNPGESIQVPDDVARHVFGYGDPDKLPYLVRQGWAHASNTIDAGMKVLAAFKFNRPDEPDSAPASELSPALAEDSATFDAADFKRK